jgi:hypothetical protein
MDQKLDRISPLFINTDKSYKNLLPEEASFITGMSIDINANPGDNIGTSNPTGEGQNDLILTPTRSNEELPNVLKPAGNNKNEGSFESVTTQ